MKNLVILCGTLLMTILLILNIGHSKKAKHIQSNPLPSNHVKTVKKANPIILKKNKKQPINRHFNVKKSPQAIAVTGAKLNKKLKGNLKGHGHDFVKAGKDNQIDPTFLAALAAQETGWGDSEISSPPINNVGGITCMPEQYQKVFGTSHPNPGCTQIVPGGTKWQKFTSLEESIHFKAAYLKKSYVDHGADTIAEIQKKYAPQNANNDKHGLNNYWEKNIVSIMKDIKPTL